MKIDLYKKNLYFGLVEKGISIGINLMLIPIALNYFGTYDYGILAIVNSILAYLTIANFGIPQAISIFIARAITNEEKKSIIKKGQKILLFYSIIFLIIYISQKNFIFNYIESKQLENSMEVIKSIMYICILFPLNLYFSIEGSIYFGFQKMYLSSIINLLQILINFILLFIVIYFKLTISIYILLINLNMLLIKIFKYLFIQKMMFDIENLHFSEIGYKEILKNGFKYLLMSISALIIANTDNFVIAKYLGVEDVTNYSVIFKIYSILLSISYIFTGAFKPIIIEKLYEKNHKFILNKIEEINKNLSILNIFIMIFTVYFLDIFIKIWTNGMIKPSIYLGLIFNAYVFLYGKKCLYHDFLAAKNWILTNTFLMIIEGGINLILSIYLIKRFGLNGVALGTLLASIPTCLLYKFLLKKEIFELGKIIIDKKLIILSILIILGFKIENIYIKLIVGYFWGILTLYLYKDMIKINLFKEGKSC